MTILIGSPAISGDDSLTPLATDINLNNPALYDGNINSIEVWANQNITGFRVGIFFLVSGTVFKCRDSVTIGNVIAGSEQTFPVSLAVKAGDYIGCYYDTGRIANSYGGGIGRRRKGGEFIDPGDSADFTAFYATQGGMSLYGIGMETGVTPQFSPGESRTAKVTMSNPTTKAFDYEGVILMGTNLVEVSRVAFSLNAGESKEIRFPVIMPSVAGTYPVYISVFSGGVSIALYKAIEDVVIVAPLPFTMSITGIETTIDKYATAYWLMQPTALISNPHSVPITHRLRCIVAFGSYDPNLLSSYIFTRCWGGGASGTPKEQLYELVVTLNPGQSVVVVSPFYYIDGWNEDHGNYEWSNMPPGMYSAGVRKKYWFRIIDELGNWSPVVSIGTA